jgi:arylsulfatase A-like enzyme
LSARREALIGFAVGAALGALGHASALVASAEGAPHDEASRRVSAELARLAGESARFAVALALAVMAASGIVGALAALLERWAWPPAPGPRRARVWRLLAVAAWTALALGASVVRAFLNQPALLEPSLGGSRGALAPALARLAASFGPRAVDALALALVACALALGAVRRRRALADQWAWARAAAKRNRRAATALAAIAALALAIAVWPRHRAPRLLVIAADSLRPDRLDDRTAPHLAALARRGISFDAALSPIARTTPSWISILTGLYPHSHGVRDMFPRRELRPAYLDYLPRRLRDAGFRTALATDYAGDFFPLFDAGFERARVPPTLTLPLVFQREVVSRSPLALALLNDRVGRALFPVMRYLMTNSDPERLADEALDELDAGDDRPAALFVFFSTTHVPFAAPAPWYRRFATPQYRDGGPHRYAYDAQRLADVTATDAGLPDADVAQIRGLYDGALAAVDAACARLLARADDRTLVVLLSDHGENLFEPGTTTHHGKWFKGGDESIRVPLVFAGAGVPAKRVGDPVSLVDVAPTVSELLQLRQNAADGRSLAPAFTGALAPRDVFVETGVWLNGPAEPDGVRYPPLPELLEADARDHFQLVLKARYEDIVVEAKQRLMRRGSAELIYLPTERGVRWQLFDTATDPHHQHDLAREKMDTWMLERELLKFLARDPERELDVRDHLVRRTED